MKKYEFTGEVMVKFGVEFKRIRAIVDFFNIKVGDVGGWIEKEENLNQSGNAWVSEDARVYGNAEVSEDARVYGNALVYGNASVYGNAEVYGDAWVYGDARVYGNALVSEDASVYGNAEVYGDALVYGNARVYGNAEVYGDASVYGNAEVYGDAWVYGDAEVLWSSKIGSRLSTTTAFKTKSGVSISCGCFYGDLAKFEQAVEKTHGNSKHGKEYKAFIMMVKAHFDLEV